MLVSFGRSLLLTSLLLLLTISTLVRSQAPHDAASHTCGMHAVPRGVVMLLDSAWYQALLGNGGFVPSAGWTQTPEGSWTGSGNFCFRNLRSCSSSSSWIVTQYILKTADVPYDLRITVDLRGNSDPNECPECTDPIRVYYYPSDGRIESGEQLNALNYNLIGSASFGASTETRSLTFSLGSEFDRFYIAVVEENSCVTLSRLQVSYSLCPSETVGLVVYPNTPIGADAVTTSASCGANAEGSPSSSLSITCNTNGTYSGSPSCSCVDGYFLSGETCSATAECLGPCQNGGTCVNGTCVCTPEYTGTLCGQNITDPLRCPLVPCQNGGTCTIRSGTCNCPSEFTGSFCAVPITDPTPCTLPCQNGGSCVNGTCICAVGFSGTYCGTDIPDPDKIITSVHLSFSPMIGILGDSIIATCTAELSVAVLGTTIEFDYGFINNTLPAVAGTTQTNMATISSVTPSTAGEYNCIVTVTVPGVCGGGGSEPSCPSKSSDPVTLRVQYITSAPSPVEVIGPFIAWGFPNSVVGEVVGYDVKLTSATGSVVIVEKNKTDVYHLLEREDVAVNLGLTTSITIQVRAVTTQGFGEWSAEQSIPVTVLVISDLIPNLLDPEPSITFINNSPIVSGKDVEIHLAINYDMSSLECRLEAPEPSYLGDNRIFRDCSSKLITYTSLQSATYKFYARAKVLSNGPVVILTRTFRPDNGFECSVHLINNGLTVTGNSTIVEYSFTGEYTRYILDKDKFYNSSSPLLLTDLSPGEHFLKIVSQPCSKELRHPLRLYFSIS